jgi:Spy/CpxP family protein refolding chaperone
MKTSFWGPAYSTFLLIVICFSSAFSQTAKKDSTPEERAQRWTTWMKEQLTLTPDQETKIHFINQKYASLNEDLKTSTENRRAKFEELKERDKRKDAELKGVLTEEQFKLYLEKKKDFQREMLGKVK